MLTTAIKTFAILFIIWLIATNNFQRIKKYFNPRITNEDISILLLFSSFYVLGAKSNCRLYKATQQ